MKQQSRSGFLAAVVVFALLLPTLSIAGENAGLEKVKGTTIHIGTSGMGGAFFPFGQSIANLALKYAGIVIVPEATAGSVENARLVGDGDVELGITGENNAYDAIRGIAPFVKKYPDLQTIGRMYPSYIQIVVPVNSPITSFADLKGKRIACGEAGSGAVIMFERMLDAYDMKMSDITPSYLGYADGFSQLADGNVDVALAQAGIPASSVMEYGATHKFRFIPIDDDKAEALIKAFPYYGQQKISKDVYGTPEDALTMVTINIIAVSKEMDENLVYWITKCIFDNLDELKSINATAADMNMELARESSVPIHPGAQRYYNEKK